MSKFENLLCYQDVTLTQIIIMLTGRLLTSLLFGARTLAFTLPTQSSLRFSTQGVSVQLMVNLKRNAEDTSFVPTEDVADVPARAFNLRGLGLELTRHTQRALKKVGKAEAPE